MSTSSQNKTKTSSWRMLSCWKIHDCSLHIEIHCNSILLAALPITPHYLSPFSCISSSVLSFLHPCHVPANLAIISTVYSSFPTSNFPSFSLSICSLHPHTPPPQHQPPSHPSQLAGQAADVCSSDGARPRTALNPTDF